MDHDDKSGLPEEHIRKLLKDLPKIITSDDFDMRLQQRIRKGGKRASWFGISGEFVKISSLSYSIAAMVILGGLSAFILYKTKTFERKDSTGISTVITGSESTSVKSLPANQSIKQPQQTGGIVEKKDKQPPTGTEIVTGMKDNNQANKPELQKEGLPGVQVSGNSEGGASPKEAASSRIQTEMSLTKPAAPAQSFGTQSLSAPVVSEPHAYKMTNRATMKYRKSINDSSALRDSVRLDSIRKALKDSLIHKREKKP